MNAPQRLIYIYLQVNRNEKIIKTIVGIPEEHASLGNQYLTSTDDSSLALS